MNIEVIGIPGSGKSTISKYLESHLSNKIILQSGVQKFPSKFSRGLIYEIFSFKKNARSLCNLGIFNLNKYICSYCINSKRLEYLPKMIVDWGNFYNYFLERIDSSNNEYKRSCENTFTNFLIDLYIIEDFRNQYDFSIIQDAGIIFRSTYLINYFLKDEVRIEEKLNKYIESSPFLPDLILNLRLDPKKSYKRINSRKSPIPLNLKGLNNNSSILILEEIQFLITKLLEIALKKGIKVINIDSDQPKVDLFKELNHHFKIYK